MTFYKGNFAKNQESIIISCTFPTPKKSLVTSYKVELTKDKSAEDLRTLFNCMRFNPSFKVIEDRYLSSNTQVFSILATSALRLISDQENDVYGEGRVNTLTAVSDGSARTHG